MSFCAIGRDNPKNWTCFTLPELQVMVKAWNQTKLGKHHPIVLGDANNYNTEDEVKYAVWSQINERFSPFCGNNEACWLDSKELGQALKKISPEMYDVINYFTLKPKGTNGKHAWLSTTEIEYVMKQFEHYFPAFRFIGCIPSDYYILNPRKFPTDILDHSKYSAIVFNQDESHQKGSHWVAIFFENKLDGQLSIEHFDSTGNLPIKNIKQFLTHPYFKGSTLSNSRFKHQKGNNECGVYSIYYILQRLQGQTMEDINSRRVSDSEMNEFRDFIFRPYSKTFSAEELLN